MSREWVDELGSLCNLDANTKKTLGEFAVKQKIPKGTVLFRLGDICSRFPFVVSGSIRIQRVTELGREFALYWVNSDETCILSTACILADEPYYAEAIAETEVIAYVISSERFNDLLDNSLTFRRLIFNGYAKRLTLLMARIEEILTSPISVRLAERLLSLAPTDNRVVTTHQSLASDLASAREVVSRVIKRFEREGWVKTDRGGIDLLDREALKRLIR